MNNNGRIEGFTLIEVLAAFLILALVAGTAFKAMRSATNSVQRSRIEKGALELAESVLARIGHDIVTQHAHFSGFDGIYRWTVNIEGQAADPPPVNRLAAYPIHVTVTWRDDRGFQSLALDSARLGEEQPVP